MSGSGFTVKVKINSTNKILKDHGLDQDGRAIRFLRDDADRLMNPYIPMDNGMLRRNKSYPSNHEIKYISPYAKYQYYGKLMLAKNGSSWAKKGEKKVLTSRNLKYHTSGTGPKWNELMMQRNKNTLIKDVENFIKIGG
ncbi:MAG TPA: minor capsid protein [Clostridiaceae bacterium]|jgi:hypothetical protein|nr:MAG TPA: Minor capsid protein [Bacteriophage sp.]HJJ11761.1 minor capsid protein [Clostridiaceae bacterium]